MSLPPERELIEILTEKASSVRNSAGLTDDCAVIPLGHKDVVASVDTFSAPTHFPQGTPARSMGRMATAAGLSDLAATGADALGVLVGYGLPPSMSVDAARELAAGVISATEDHGGELLGGDTKPRDPLALSITALGTAPPGRSMSRSGARPGDLLVVTGPVGGAAAALARIEDGLDPAEATPLLDPTPRIRVGRRWRELGVRCAVDLSDGVAEAAVVIAEASQVQVEVEATSLPLHPWAEDTEVGLDGALSIGGDYELVGAIPQELQERAREAADQAGAELHVIGRVRSGQGAVLTGPQGREALERGWQHRFEDQGPDTNS